MPIAFLRRLFVLLFATALAAPLARADLPPSVARALKDAGIPENAVGVYVQPAESDKAILAHGADQALNPASVMKLVTTYAGLELLGPGYTWRTEAYRSGELKGETLEGDLILKGYGDPKLNLENFWLLLRKLRQTGLKDIRGDLLLDGSHFDPRNGDPGAFDQRPYRAYNVGPEGLLVHYRLVALRLTPEPEQGRARVVMDPPLAPVQLTARVGLSAAPCDDWRAGLVTDVQPKGETVTVSISGAFPAACEEKELLLSVLDNSRYVESLFRSLWAEQGGSLRGTARTGRLPANARLLAAHESPPLSEVIRDINKFSNNVMARQLFLTLGAPTGGRPENAFAAVREWLARKRLSMPELMLENGAGLSRNERISARHLGQLLAAAWRSPVMPEFVASLPIAAVDGTMKKRLTDSPAAGRVHVKTGLLDGAKSLAGYVLDRRGRYRVVVFVINHPRATYGQTAQDALLDWVHQLD